jgi:1-acyl-sn-glycerol-3-phosphate acyltransferase
MSIIKIILIAIITVADTFRVLVMMMIKGGDVFSGYSKKWSRKLLKVMGVKLGVAGLENIDSSKSYIYAANHSSLLDIPVLLATLPGDARIIYKRELEKIPIFGYGLRKSPFIGIDRTDPRKAMQSIMNALEMTKNGASIIIFPEGTRDAGREVGPFKRGGFLLAEKARRPIVPVAVTGTYDIIPPGKFKIKSGEVNVSILPPIETARLIKEEMRTLKDNVRDKLIEELSKKSE